MTLPSRLLRIVFLVVVSLFLAQPTDVLAKGGKSGSSGGQKTVHVKGYTTKKGKHVDGYDRKKPSKRKGAESGGNTAASPSTSVGSSSVKRDANGRIERSEAAKHEFMKQTGYPNGRPGYVVDHIRPLACGGADAPSNMQWQTIEAAKAKDAVERQGC